MPRDSLKKLAVGQKAPDFVLPSVQGRMVRLSELQNKIVVLDFTTTWCGMTLEEHNNFDQIQERYGDEIVFITIDAYSYDTLEDLASYQKQQKRNWTFVLDKDLEVAKLYGVRQTVSTFVINKEGTISYSDNWITSTNELDSVLQEII